MRSAASAKVILLALWFIASTASSTDAAAEKKHRHGQKHKHREAQARAAVDLISAAAQHKDKHAHESPELKHHQRHHEEFREDEGVHHSAKAASHMPLSAEKSHHHEEADGDSSLLEGRHRHTSHTRHTSTTGLALRQRPSAESPVVGQLDEGTLFEASSAREGPDGAVWLELADHSGWVPQDKVLQVPQKRSRNSRRRFTGTNQRLSLADKQEPSKKSDKMHMDQSKLPKTIRHINEQTVTADWHNEYPMTPDPTLAVPQDSASRWSSLSACLFIIVCGMYNVA